MPTTCHNRLFHPRLVRVRVAAGTAVVAIAVVAACSDSSEPDPDPGYQGTAGAAFVPDSGADTEPVSPDQLPTREELCAHEPPSGGLPLRHCPCEKLTCGDLCDPCMGCSGPTIGCGSVDGGTYRCSSGDICTQTVD